jgi:hypothetical protein
LALFRTILTPAWVSDWYATHDLHGGGGVFTPLLTLWLAMNQRLPGQTTYDAVWQTLTLAQARLFSPHSQRLRDGPLSPAPSGYSYARQHLPLSVVEAACQVVFADLLARTPAGHQPVGSPAGTPLYLLDGSTLSVAASPALTRAYPPSHNQHGVSHWPVVRFVVAHELDSGLAVRPVWGPQYGPRATSEQALTVSLLAQIPRGAWVVADRNFGVFSVAWAITAHQQTPLVRLTADRARKLLGPGCDLSQDSEHAVVWTPSRQDRKTTPSLPPEAQLAGRVLVRHLEHEGERIQVCLFTTDLEATAEELLAAYGKRWTIEVDLRTLKQTVSLESTGVRSPALLAQDLLLGITAYNLIRWVMREAAATRGWPVRRISHSHALHCVQAYAPRLERAATEVERQSLWTEMLRVIAAVPLPVRTRPGRARQVWKKGHSYPFRAVPGAISSPVRKQQAARREP